DRAERGENNTEASVEASTSSESVTTPAPVVAAAVSETVETNYVAPTPSSTPSVVAAPAPVVAATPVVAAEVAAPVAPAPLPKVEFKPLQTSELTSVIESAGMVWVNTDHQKLEEVRAQIAAEPAIVYPPREPKPPVEISTGPMVLVETGGKEQTIQK
ncbi:MAG: ribonuclease E/G, partial [Polynucleobacter victoriensis]